MRKQKQQTKVQTMNQTLQSEAWVIIPAHNEAERIVKVIEKTKQHVQNIIVVDDGSSDNTYEISRHQDVIVLKHAINIGKGAALKTGCDFATKKGAKIMISIDADGQHNPEEIPNFIREIKKGNDIVFGYRQMSKKMPFIFRFGNNFINRITKYIYKIDMKDTQCGYRAFTADAYKKIRWQSQSYEMESEMIANAGKHNLKYKEVPIQTIYADKYKGTTIIDGIKIVLKMFWWKFKK